MEWIFLPLDGSVNRDNFDCGIPELNEYLQKYARQNPFLSFSRSQGDPGHEGVVLRPLVGDMYRAAGGSGSLHLAINYF